MRFPDTSEQWVCGFGLPEQEARVTQSRTITIRNLQGAVLYCVTQGEDGAAVTLSRILSSMQPQSLLPIQLYAAPVSAQSALSAPRWGRNPIQLYLDLVRAPKLYGCDDSLEWGGADYTLVRRTCIRCPICQALCGREGWHLLCAHTDEDHSHLWRLRKVAGSEWLSAHGFLYGSTDHLLVAHSFHPDEL